MKAMNAMKATKPVRASTVAKGKTAKWKVFKGMKLKTGGGLKKDDLMRSRSNKGGTGKAGKVVSIKKSEQGRRSKWARATAAAREAKGYTGFKGGSFYAKAK